jgi:hypothetical protein
MPLYAELEAQGLALLITAICVGVGGIATGIVTLVVGYLDRKATRLEKDEERKQATAKELRMEARQDAQARAVAEVARKAEDVKKTLAESTTATATKLDGIAKTSDAIHILTNNNMGEQLKLNMDLARWKADQGTDPDHIAAAEAAEKKYREHMEKQAVVDAGKTQSFGGTS